MATLLLRLKGPMQSWGIESRFSNRDTLRDPTKSGVIGLLLAANGTKRDDTEETKKLSHLKMMVRVDKEGILERDFHTVQDVAKASGSGTKNVTSDRFYLADADFLVALEGDIKLLEKYHKALADPKWHTFLGRKSFVPSMPVYLPDGMVDKTAEKALLEYPIDTRRRGGERIRLVVECEAGEGEMRKDVPISYANREFATRYVKYEYIDPPGTKEGK